MTYRISGALTMDELARLKKTLLFIRNVITDYQANSYDHVGFSHALALSKAEELEVRVEPYCPAYSAFQGLTRSMKQFFSDRSAISEAEQYLDAIFKAFELERVLFVKR